MTEVTAESLTRLRAGLPSSDPGTEVILRTDGDRATAMLRPSGAPPRVFALEQEQVRELRIGEDADLPAAALLGDDARLTAALADELGPLAEPRLVAWRPGKRAVVRVRSGTSLLFVKFLDRRTYARAAATFAALAAASAPLHFARATRLLPEHCAYVAPAAPGTALRELLAQGLTPRWDLVDAALRALATTPTADGMPVYDFAAARGAAVKMLRKAAPVDARLAELAARTADLSPPAPGRGFVHGDLHDKQLFLQPTSVHLIDLEGVGAGDPGFDQANLAEHLRLRALQQAGADDGTADALLDRLGMAATDRLCWRACIRARLCGVYALRPRWSNLTLRLMSETERLLTDLA